MNTNETNTATPKNTTTRLGMWAIVVAAILMIPYVTNMPWTRGDYIFAGIVLSACAITYELATRTMKKAIHKAGVAVAVLCFIVLVMGWAATGP